MAESSRGRVGVWLIGARGSVATTTVVGAAALASDLVPPIGLVTALPAFADVRLPGLGDLVFGGHDLVDDPLRKRAEGLASAGVLPDRLPVAVAGALDEAEAELRPGIEANTGAPREAIARVQADLRAFARSHRLDTVVVVNCATTEAPPAPDAAHDTLEALEDALDAGRAVLPASSLYAYAALDAGMPFVDFTPSPGARLPALDTLARERRVPYAGSDGKTGETLVKAALAAMFADRHLQVRSWSGTNLLGGGDGAALADEARAAVKRRSKSLGLEAILGRGVDHHVDIGYVAELGEWKTAWDLVTFDGFLGTSMRLQFVWEGADSALAAPLVIDLARLTGAARAAGEAGPLAPLAFYFKDPVGSTEHRLDHQWAMLLSWARSLGPGR